MKTLKAAKNWFKRRMLRISWADKVSTSDLFRRAGKEKGLLQNIIHRQMTLLGLWHIVRKLELETVVLTGYIEGTLDR